MISSGVTSDDVEKSIGRPLTPAEQAQVVIWVKEAETLIGIRLGFDANLNDDVLSMVVREAVIVRIQRGKTGGASSITVAVDDSNVTRRYDENTTTAGSAWWFLPEWWEWLSPETETSAFTIRPGRAR